MRKLIFALFAATVLAGCGVQPMVPERIVVRETVVIRTPAEPDPRALVTEPPGTPGIVVYREIGAQLPTPPICVRSYTAVWDGGRWLCQPYIYTGVPTTSVVVYWGGRRHYVPRYHWHRHR
jgi:hypothetical protein